MGNFNQVTLMGNVTRDPQMKYLPSQTAVCEFGLATHRKFRSQQGGEDKEETCFVDCTAFGKQAEVLNLYAAKGKPLFITGRLKYDTWEDKQGGKRSKLTVVVENFQFIGSKDGGGSFVGAAAESDRRETRPTTRTSQGRDREERQWRSGGKSEPAGQEEGSAETKFQQADIPF